MTIVDPIVPRASAEIARVAFLMFVYVADIEKNITPQEVRRFQTLLNETAWIENHDLRGGLSELKDGYSSFWANYEDGVFAADAASIAEGLDGARRHLGEERSRHLRHELNRFLERLDHGPYGAKLISSDQRARSRARKELLSILSMEDQQLATISRRPCLERVDDAVTVAVPAAPTPAEPLWPAAGLSPVATQVWAAGKTKVRCVSVVTETHDAKTYVFIAEPQTLFHYKPGQFVTIEVPIQGTILRRSYTISSSPSRPYTLSITVKKVPMGWMSNWLFDNVAEGFECTINGPTGRFTCLDHPAEKLLFLAAGSGITPSMSMLRWLADTSSKADIVFINNVRTPDDIIFHQELLHLSTRLGERMRLMIVPGAIPAGRPWNGPVGKFDEILLRMCAPDFAEREAFVCGPPGYMSAAKSLLESVCFPLSRYHDESFGAGSPVAASPSASAFTSPAAPKPLMAVSFARPAVTTAALLPLTSIVSGSAPAAVQAIAPSILRNAATGTAPRAAPLPALALQARPSGLAAQKEVLVAPQSASPLVFRSPAPGAKPMTSSSPGVAFAAPSNGSKIHIQGSGASFTVRPGQTILDAAEAANVTLEHSCRAGICGACKIRKVSGHVVMDEQTILSRDDIGAGYVLTCIGRVVGDVTLSG